MASRAARPDPPPPVRPSVPAAHRRRSTPPVSGRYDIGRGGCSGPKKPGPSQPSGGAPKAVGPRAVGAGEPPAELFGGRARRRHRVERSNVRLAASCAMTLAHAPRHRQPKPLRPAASQAKKLGGAAALRLTNLWLAGDQLQYPVTQRCGQPRHQRDLKFRAGADNVAGAGPPGGQRLLDDSRDFRAGRRASAIPGSSSSCPPCVWCKGRAALRSPLP